MNSSEKELAEEAIRHAKIDGVIEVKRPKARRGQRLQREKEA